MAVARLLHCNTVLLQQHFAINCYKFVSFSTVPTYQLHKVEMGQSSSDPITYTSQGYLRDALTLLRTPDMGVSRFGQRKKLF